MNVDVVLTELEIESVLMRRHYHRIMDDLQERFGPCQPNKACKVVGIDFQDQCRATPVDGGVVITLTHRSV